MEVSVHYRTVRETHDKCLPGTTWDIHVVEDSDQVLIHEHGYVTVVDVNENIFMYPLSNVISVRITQ